MSASTEDTEEQQRTNKVLLSGISQGDVFGLFFCLFTRVAFTFQTVDTVSIENDKEGKR